MKESDSVIPLHAAPIPQIFWSDVTCQPFENCIKCERYLLEEGTLYLIEKAIKSYVGFDAISTVFEYAMCMDCAHEMHKELSVSSRTKIETYFEQNTNFDARRNELKENLEINNWIQNCIITGERPTEGGEYQIYGQCDGKHFLYHDFPYMMSGEVVDSLIDLMSNKTLDELNNFKNNLTQGPSEFQELLNSGGARVFV
jgi:hypothetical protein